MGSRDKNKPESSCDVAPQNAAMPEELSDYILVGVTLPDLN